METTTIKVGQTVNVLAAYEMSTKSRTRRDEFTGRTGTVAKIEGQDALVELVAFTESTLTAARSLCPVWINVGRLAPQVFIAIEFKGSGDPMFGGEAADWPLCKNGQFMASPRRDEVATFPTRQMAEDAASVTIRRKDSKVGILERA